MHIVYGEFVHLSLMASGVRCCVRKKSFFIDFGTSRWALLQQIGTKPLVTSRSNRHQTVLIGVSQGLAALAAFNIARGDEQSVEEAVDLLNEACATTKDADEEEETAVAEGNVSSDVETGGEGDTAAPSAALLAHASVLCTSAQGELLLERGTATASDRLGEALRIREKLLPAGHPATVRV